MSVIETEMLAHFVDLDVSSEFILGLPPEKRGEICIFQRRKESEKSQRAFAFTICNVHLRTESAVDQRKVMGLEI